MWEKIAKEMQLPWRAAEAMHWQIGEVEMAQRANVPVFHLAHQPGSSNQAGPGSEGRSSTSPTGIAPTSGFSYTHTHNHSLPQIPHAHTHPHSPEQSRLRRNSSDSLPGGPSLRRRADSARSVPSSATPLGRGQLPPLIDVAGTASATPRYTLPPVVTSSDRDRR